MTAARFCDLAMHGFCNMIPTVAIIFFVFVMQQGMTDIGIASYVIDAVRPVISPVLLPAITFLLVAALNFATGSTWGIPALVSPIILPLALSIVVNPLVVMGAIVSGATLGSHACFYSDATVLTSSCCKMNNMDHSALAVALCYVCGRDCNGGLPDLRFSSVMKYGMISMEVFAYAYRTWGYY